MTWGQDALIWRLFLRLQDLPDLAPDLRYIALKYNQYFYVDAPCQEQDQVNQWCQINAS
ncbi:hypothetical protein [Pelagimonas phthalicica]|uniref:hypothetical protein n=1 Tax=Pelagimonas phthalicica TaxID=1037362 RepID=UPI0014151661|nr:hypothetical protein [Pelagimonas phthalicica]